MPLFTRNLLLMARSMVFTALSFKYVTRITDRFMASSWVISVPKWVMRPMILDLCALVCDCMHDFSILVDCSVCMPRVCSSSRFVNECGLENVRIPREHMLAKWQHIDDDGKYVKATKKKVIRF